ncbi:MHS family alpha-ketoglutarate permease-like MFS transporter [Saccharopolyspora erythraea NRRL 2338]|uniref:MFS transporter n=2 Tax=Saccharopolyspora erythraea TaxID=1836 RepID=A0ABP3NHJ8_SACER|nr:MFS transporter [Saccharopolyspora erythraea]EQD86248.1 major facilitator transporter [Saccharopolyspora erythraea D]PFG95711.1 MHS family alpha-ketoglutarate permease-like MFS transporter [Saccharopolyspora erythraea NRRL 2338]QRK92307.1 MFS transporter [Saccharopolyspora erythraea]CAM01966.1 general substrate transporter [Saccharopolyspora erythraea NRRL 2338]
MAESTLAAKPASRSRTLLGTGVGNALEWYDWGIYAVFAPFFAQQFFNAADPFSAILSTLAVFAVGFLARPIGAWLFGLLADRRGRRMAMTLSVGGAAVGSLAIGLSPTYAAVGAGASLILLTARLVQGLAHGGEMPSAQTYISEMAPARRRGLWASLMYFSGTLGTIAGTGVGAVLTTVLSEPQMNSWGWRIPFVLGGILGLYALVMRQRMSETEAFRTARTDPEPMWAAIVRHRRQALQVIGMTVGLTVSYYAWAVSAPQYAISARGVDPTGALWAGLLANVVFIAVLPLWGALADRIGRKPVMLISAGGMALAIFPLDGMIGSSPVRLFAAMSVAMVLIAASAAIAPAVYCEMFPTRIRTVGVGIPYAVAVATFGGTAPYLQTWVGQSFGAAWFTGYIAALLLVSAVIVTTLPETRGRRLD